MLVGHAARNLSRCTGALESYIDSIFAEPYFYAIVALPVRSTTFNHPCRLASSSPRRALKRSAFHATCGLLRVCGGQVWLEISKFDSGDERQPLVYCVDKKTFGFGRLPDNNERFAACICQP